MIGKLSGNIDSIARNHLVLDVQGVGYIVHASSRTLSRIGQAGDTASLLIETQVREDAITLYGFADPAEKSWFRLLTSVQGVGAKAGLSILSVCPPDQMGFILASQDKAALTRADGVGPKLAARILTELKDKAGDIDLSLAKPGAPAQAVQGTTRPAPASSVEGDAVSALVNLGYARAEAYSAVMRALAKAGEESEETKDNLQAVIRLALKELSA